MKSLMYHYVRPSDAELPHLKHLHFEDFQKQLDYLDDTYGFVSKEEFLLSVKNCKPVDGVVLTFDDGLKCHHQYVFPELKKRGLWGMFYVPTGVYTRKKILDVHRIHILLARVDSTVIYNALLELVTDDILVDASRTEFKELTYKRQDNDAATNMVKRILNYYISYEHRERIIDQLMNSFIPEDVSDVSRFYITEQEIEEMHNGGMVIGSHTVNHPVMSKLSENEQFYEINTSFGFLEGVCGNLPIKTFCYPYGGFHSFTATTEDILENAHCLFSFNVEQRDISARDLEARRQALPRYDCNQFKYGQVR